jgi:hypothetical protein
LRELLIILSRRSREVKDNESDQLEERIRSLPIDWLSEIIINDNINIFDIDNNADNNPDNITNKEDNEEESEF